MEQRVLKFRVWDKIGKIYISNDFELGDGDDGYLGKRENDSAIFTTDVIFQQFTGLKDKNNKDIYEGDIIKENYDRLRGYVADFDKSKTNVNDGLWTYGDFNYISRVIWCEIYHSFVVNRQLNGKKEEDRMFPLNGANIELIGNIFENPDLLK